jgi:hypothetical protein
MKKRYPITVDLETNESGESSKGESWRAVLPCHVHPSVTTISMAPSESYAYTLAR